MGGDAEMANVISMEKVSIHAPAWGATEFLETLSSAFLVSIHAPAWGATVQPGAKVFWL